MKRFVKSLLAISLGASPILGTSALIHQQVARAQEIDFHLLSPLAGQREISGQDYPEEMIELTINGTELETRVESDGSFTFENLPELESGTEIILTQGENEIHTSVRESDQEAEIIPLLTPFNPTGLIDEEQDLQEESEATDSEITEETSEEEESLNEDDPDAVEEEELAEEESSTEENDADSEEDLSGSDQSDSDEPEEQIATFQAVPEEEAVPESFDTGDISEDRTARVSTYSEFRSALQNNSVEQIIFNNAIRHQSGDSTANPTINSPNRRKVIDGAGYSLEIPANVYFNSQNNNDDVIVRNMSNMFSTQTTRYGMWRFTNSTYNLHLENVTYNRNNRSDVGHLAVGWESDIHFYGNVTVNMQTTGEDYVTHMKGAYIHDGANVTINGAGDVFRSSNTGGTDGTPTGLMIGNNANVNITTGNYVVNNSFNRSNISETNLTVGTNSTVNLNSTNGSVLFSNQSDILLDVGENSSLYLNAAQIAIEGRNNYTNQNMLTNIRGQLTIEAGTGFYFGRQNQFDFTVYPGGSAVFNTQNYGINHDHAWSGGPINFTVHPGAEWHIQNARSNPAIRLQRNASFNINEPNRVDWQSGGLVISTNANHQFTIQNLQMESWHTNPGQAEADVVTEPYEIGSFTLTPSGFTNINLTPNRQSGVFPDQFRRDMRRWVFQEMQTLDLSVQEEIFDTDTSITGTTSPNSTVILQRGEDTFETSADGEGNFTFTLEEPFNYNDELTFTARLSGIESETVERTVLGNRLSFTVRDFVYEQTIIENIPNLIIPRQSLRDGEGRYDASQAPEIEVINTRGANWQLRAQANGPLTSSQYDHQLQDALYYRNPQNPDQLESIESNGAVLISSSSDDQASENHQINWNPDEGIIIQTNPIEAYNDQYMTTVRWELSDGPQ